MLSPPKIDRRIDSDRSRCRIMSTTVLARIGDKWTIYVVGALSERALYFSELKRLIGGISQRMLTLTLRGLERDGLVTRMVHPTTPPRVQYELTVLGRTLVAPLEVLGRWALANRAEVEAARARFDRAT